MSRKARLSSVVLTTWLMLIIAFMLFRQNINLEIFFVITMISLIVVVALINTTTVQPRYLRRVKYLVATAFLIFGYIVANRIVEILTL